MPDTWMTVAEAAISLKVHPRTIERRIASGKIQSRRADDGQIQVLVATPDMPDSAPDTAFETVRDLAADQVTFAKGSASALVKFAQNDAIRSRDELLHVRHDVWRARQSALIAWCIVAVMGIGVCAAVGWTAQKITRANADVQNLSSYADKMEREAHELLSDRDRAQQEAQTARLREAEAAGRLSAYVEQSNRPTTRPTGLAERIASVFAGE
jgi:outer membrane murein-binding lipoprotein Lpp